jgi:hypothetical protein
MTTFADIYRNRPARGSALADQLRAAEMHAAETLVAESMHLGSRGTEPPFDPERGTGPVRKIIDRFRQADESGQLSWCRHLKPGSPQPAAWQAWRPSRMPGRPSIKREPTSSPNSPNSLDLGFPRSGAV